MQKKKILFIALFCISALSVYSQKMLDPESITATNLGDGRQEYKLTGKKKPLSGTYKIADKNEYLIIEFKNGLFDGPYEHYKNGDLIQRIHYKEGLWEGLYTDYYNDGSVKIERTFTKGKLNGILKEYYPDGSLQKEKEYKDGKEHGIDRYYERGFSIPRREHNYFEGFQDGKQVRNASKNEPDEYAEIEYYEKGIRVGDYLQTWSNGIIKESGRYENGKKEGLWIRNYENGNRLMEVTYKNNNPIEEAKSFFKDGSPERISTYSEDRTSRITKEFFPGTGIVSSEYTYDPDFKEGPYKLYYEDGTVREEGICENGSEIYAKLYYKNGQVKEVYQINSRGRMELIESYDSEGKQL